MSFPGSLGMARRGAAGQADPETARLVMDGRPRQGSLGQAGFGTAWRIKARNGSRGEDGRGFASRGADWPVKVGSYGKNGRVTLCPEVSRQGPASDGSRG